MNPRVSRRTLMNQFAAAFALAASPGKVQAATRKPEWPENIIRHGTPGYEDVRQATIWAELKPNRFPAAISQPSTTREVIDLVNFASRNNLSVNARGSGHNYYASFLEDGNVMLDLSGMNEITIDGEYARIGPGVQSGPLALTLQESGRAFPTAHNADVGLAGFLLGGGMGWNGEDWGQFACYSVESIDVVTADGALVTASSTSEPDLFWAARGGGVFFPGVVVGFQLKTKPFPAGMMGSQYLYAGHRAEELAQWLAPIGDTGHRNLECFLTMEATEQTGQSGQIERTDKCRVYALAYSDDREQSRNLLEQLGSTAPEEALSRMEYLPMTFAELYGESITGPVMRIMNDSVWTDDPVAAARTLSRCHRSAPSSGSVSVIDFRSSPALPADAPMLAGKSYTTMAAQWRSPADDEANAAWLESMTEALEPITVGCYLNETDIHARRDRLARCLSVEARERLRAVRKRYDPGGTFSSLVPL